MPFLWGSAFIMMFVLRDLHFSFFESLLFLLGIIIFLAYSFQNVQDDKAARKANNIEEEERPKLSIMAIVMVIGGGVLVWLSADYTIMAIQKLSTIAGIKPEIIALSAVAIGTSLPEIIVSVNAARKGKAAIAVGNVLGSNIFNTYVVMSVPSFFGKLTISEEMISFYVPLMIVMTVLFGVVSNNKKITRWEGVLLLLFYVYFLGELLGDAL